MNVTVPAYIMDDKSAVVRGVVMAKYVLLYLKFINI